MTNERKAYPSDVSNEEWHFCVAYLTLMKADAPQRERSRRELFKGLRWLARTGRPWRLMPHDLPPWHAVYQQTRRWVRAGCFETLVEDLRLLLRLAAERHDVPSAMILDSRTLQSTPESRGRVLFNGRQQHKCSMFHIALDTRAHPLALKGAWAHEHDPGQFAAV